MSIEEGKYALYALAGPNHLVYCRIKEVDKASNLVKLEVRNHGRIELTVPLRRRRFQVLPNSLVPTAAQIIGSEDVGNMEEILEAVTDVGKTAVAFAAPSLAGGAALMSSLSTIGGAAGTVGGVLIVTTTPAMLAANTLDGIIEKHENDKRSSDLARIGMAAGAAAGGAGVISSVAAAGSVAGLSGAGITSGLAFLGAGSLTTGGAGMVGGLMICSGIVVVPVVALGLAAWAISRSVNEPKNQREYNEFCQRWQSQGYQGPS